MSQRSSFSIVFAVFEYTVPFGSDSTANRVSFLIDCNSEVLQDGVGMYSGCDVTFVKRKLHISVRCVKRSIANGIHYAKIVASVLLQVRCHCTSGVCWCVWKNVEWAAYTESTYSVCSCLRYIIM